MALLHRAVWWVQQVGGRGKCEPPAPVRRTCGREATPGESPLRAEGSKTQTVWSDTAAPNAHQVAGLVVAADSSVERQQCCLNCQNVVKKTVLTALPASRLRHHNRRPGGGV
jgi:hypothetical protein